MRSKRICFILICLFLTYNDLYAQRQKAIEPAILECLYEHTMLNDTLNPKSLILDRMILRIGKTMSQFFSQDTFYGDSLWNDPQGKFIAHDLTMKAVRSHNMAAKPGVKTTSDYIYKKSSQGEISTYTTLVTTGITFKEKVEDYQGMLIDSVKANCGYDCRLAKTDFRGRSYFVWFAPDLPISDGPWKFSGLPGLILEVYDSKDHYHYTIVSIRSTNLLPVSFYNFWEYKYEKTERKKYLRGLWKAFTDTHPMRTLKASTGIDLGTDEGRVINPMNRDFLERDYR